MLGRTTEAVIEYGGRTELAGGTVLTERYAGTVGTTQDRPGRAWATGEAGYRIDEWPEATVATTTGLDSRGAAEAFDLRLDLEVRDGGKTPWRRRIPRRLG